MASPGHDQTNPAPADNAHRLDSWKEVASYLGRSVPTVQRWEKKEGLPVHRHVHEKQGSVYAYKSELDAWWRERGPRVAPGRLEGLQSSVHALLGALRVASSLRRRLLLLTAAIGALIVVLTAWQLRAAKIRWARQQALPQIEQLASLDSLANSDGEIFFRAFLLASEAERYIPTDPRLRKLWPSISRLVNVTTEPDGADLYISSYSGRQSLHLGRSSLHQARVPEGFLRWRVEKEGYEAFEGILDPVNGSSHIVLGRDRSSPTGMVRATGGNFELGLRHLGAKPPFEMGDYWIDKYEVTNREFKKFVDAGGYSDPSYWKFPFLKDGRRLSFTAAISFFRDRTGRIGPETWEAGDFPQGKADYPVTGVSWYESAAYAEFVGKSLPTIYHWTRAAGIFATSAIVPLSNFSGKDLAPIGQHHGISAVGAYDMAGNVKEWCFNASNNDERFILGGAWNEPVYMFSEADGQPPFSRAENYGIRLVKYITPPPSAVTAAVEYPRRDFSKEKPVKDAVFKFIRGLYAYDKSPLHVRAESVDDSDEHWRKEKVSFDATYGSERVIAYLFLPRNAQPPYQTVIYFPGSSVIQMRSASELQPALNGAVVKSGRAFVFPIYKGTLERSDTLNTDYPAETDFYREHVIDWYRDLARTLDYLQTRSDIDASRVAYYGHSWGARLGPLFLALEPRLKTAVLVGGGLKFARAFPEADPFNFASRVKVPVLMINGRYDYFFPVETAQRPLFQLLGTPTKDKRHVVLDSGHAPPTAPVVKELLEWLDLYLGPVGSVTPQSQKPGTAPFGQ